MAIQLGAKHTVSGPSVNKNVGIFGEEKDQEVWSPSSPDLYIWDHEVIVNGKFGDGTGYSISQVPANFNFISNSKIEDTYRGLIDVAAQKGENIYKGRLELEERAVRETFQSIQSTHNTLILKWKCRGDHVPFGGGGGLDVSTKITVVQFLPPNGLDLRKNFHLARLNYPPASNVRNGDDLSLKIKEVQFFRRIRWAFIDGPQEQLDEIYQVKYTTDQRSDIRTESGASLWTLKGMDSFVKAEITMVSGQVVTKQISL